jgi:hypothetical protein
MMLRIEVLEKEEEAHVLRVCSVHICENLTVFDIIGGGLDHTDLRP